MIRLLLVAVLLTASLARADAPYPHWVYVSLAATGAWKETKLDACAAYASQQAGGPYFNFVLTNGGNNCGASRNVSGTIVNVGWSGSFISNSLCWDGSAPNTTKPLDQQCPNKCPPAGNSAGSTDVTSGWATGPDVGAAYAKKVIPDGGWSTSSWCNGSCTITPSGPPTSSRQNQSPGPNGYYEIIATGPMQFTGASCTPDAGNGPRQPGTEPTDPPPEKNRCPLGTKQTGTDSAGTPICTGDPNTPPAPKQTTTTKVTNPDGSTTETTTEKTTNSDGSTTTRTVVKTTWPDGHTTGSDNTTVGTKPSGGQGTDTSSDPAQYDLCKQNPMLTICRNSQISGTCDQVSCDGDAITCAIARQVSIKNCKDQAAEDAIKASSQYSLGNAVMSGADPMGSTLPTKANADTVNVGALSADGFAGGGACFSDKSFSILGKTVVVPFSAACGSLAALRYVVMLIALLGAFKLLSGAILRR